jgi:ribosomal protein S18 acetylase RimI-like enzyme
MNNIQYSELESRRFGKKIFRGKFDTIDIDLIRTKVFDADADVTIFRVPVAEQPKLYLLKSLHYEDIIADTLVYYSLDLNKATFKPVKNEALVIRPAIPSDIPAFEQIVPEIFADYTNHYSSNYQLNKSGLTAGYTEWAIGYIEKDQKLNFLALWENVPVGFITCDYSPTYAEIILNGVLPAYEGRGIYTDLLRHVKSFFREMNIPNLRVSTQIQNFRVQNVWSREGFFLDEAFLTIHLNKKSLNDTI